VKEKLENMHVEDKKEKQTFVKMHYGKTWKHIVETTKKKKQTYIALLNYKNARW
jgi:hypothetical protein